MAIALAVLATGVVASLIAVDSGSAGRKPSARLTAPNPLPDFTSGAPLTEPPVVKSSGGVLKTTLVAENGTVSVSGVDISNTQTYAAGSLPRGFLGPTLRIEPGDTIDITLDNRLLNPDDVRRGPGDDDPVQLCPPKDDPHAGHEPPPPDGKQVTNLHFHGLHVTPRTRSFHGQPVYGDNVLLNLPPGRSHFRFRVPKDHDQGTFWYHAHRHGCTDDQVYRGLAGLLLIGDVRRTLPARFRDVTTRSLLLKDIEAISYNGGWAIPNDHDWGDENLKQRTVNGLKQPKLTIRPGETQLWRVLNVSSALWYNVALVDPAAGGDAPDVFTVVAEDGNPATRPQRLRSVVLGPGHRVDILVRGSQTTRRLETLPFNQGRLTFPQETLATVEPSGAGESPLAGPGTRGHLPRFPPKRGPTRHFRFSFAPDGPGPPDSAWINGKAFDPEHVDVSPRRGTTEKWILTNETTEWHPFHIHQDDFRVISVNGKRVRRPPGDQDVVGLPPMRKGVPGRVAILMPFQTFRGEFVFHCHILDHEDAGMMALVKVR